MAKTNGRLKLIAILITLAGIIAAVAVSYGAVRDGVEDNETAVSELKVEGCLPAQELKTKVAVIQTDLKYIRKSVDEIKEAVKK